ncbi:MAG: hypothetical protein AAFX09_12895 [Pseudomonadota bacterium]
MLGILIAIAVAATADEPPRSNTGCDAFARLNHSHLYQQADSAMFGVLGPDMVEHRAIDLQERLSQDWIRRWLESHSRSNPDAHDCGLLSFGPSRGEKGGLAARGSPFDPEADPRLVIVRVHAPEAHAALDVYTVAASVGLDVGGVNRASLSPRGGLVSDILFSSQTDITPDQIKAFQHVQSVDRVFGVSRSGLPLEGAREPVGPFEHPVISSLRFSDLGAMTQLNARGWSDERHLIELSFELASTDAQRLPFNGLSAEWGRRMECFRDEWASSLDRPANPFKWFAGPHRQDRIRGAPVNLIGGSLESVVEGHAIGGFTLGFTDARNEVMHERGEEIWERVEADYAVLVEDTPRGPRVLVTQSLLVSVAEGNNPLGWGAAVEGGDYQAVSVQDERGRGLVETYARDLARCVAGVFSNEFRDSCVLGGDFRARRRGAMRQQNWTPGQCEQEGASGAVR